MDRRARRRSSTRKSQLVGALLILTCCLLLSCIALLLIALLGQAREDAVAVGREGQWDVSLRRAPPLRNTSAARDPRSHNSTTVGDSPEERRRDDALRSLLNQIRLFMTLTQVPHNATTSSQPSHDIDEDPSMGAMRQVGYAEGQCYLSRYAGLTGRSAPVDIFRDYYTPLDAECSVNLLKLNVEAENELQDDGYTLRSTPRRSLLYDDVSHAGRRGYGVESSIFVSLLPPPLDDAILPREGPTPPHKQAWVWGPSARAYQTMCAMTVESIFRQSAWPLGVSVGLIEWDFIEKGTEFGFDYRGQRHPISTDHVLTCEPRSFVDHDSEDSLRFQFKDNIRHQRVPVPFVREDHTSSVPKPRIRAPLYATAVHAARLATLQLYRGESYVLWLTSGQLLAPQWDWRSRLLLIHTPQSARAVLSTRPVAGATSAAGHSAENEGDKAQWRQRVLLAAYTRVMEHDLRSSQQAETPTGGSTMAAHRQWLHYSSEPTLGYAEVRQALLRQPQAYGLFTVPAVLHKLLRQSEAFARWGSQAQTADVSFADGHLAAILRERYATPPDPVDVGRRQPPLFRLRLAEGPTSSESLSVEELWAHVLQGGSYPAPSDNAAETPPCMAWLDTAQKLLHKRAYELCWLVEHRVALQGAVAEMAVGATHGSTAPRLKTLKLRRRRPANSTSRDDDTFPLRVEESAVGDHNYTDCLTDRRYIQPPVSSRATVPPSAQWGGKLANTTPGAGPPRFPQQAVASHAFLFTRAEVFFEVPRRMRLFTTSAAGEAGGEGRSNSTEVVVLDQFLHLLTLEEADVYLSMRLWMSGYNIWALTETLSTPFFERLHDLSHAGVRQPPSTPERIPAEAKEVQLLRRATTRRLRHLFAVLYSYSNGKSTAANRSRVTDEEALVSYFRFAGLERVD